MDRKMISKSMKMADLVHLNYLLLFVLDRFGIKLGFGDKTIQEVCGEYNLDADFFVEIANSFLDEDYVPSSNIDTFPAQLAIDYLRNTHNYYLEEKVPEIEGLINQMVTDCKLDRKNIDVLNNFFYVYKQELTDHIKREEDAVFPYVLQVAQAYREGVISDKLYQKMNEYNINDYASEHDNVEQKLYDLKNIIIKYLPPVENSLLCHKILIELFNLEKDLNDHALLEDKLIVPIIARQEERLQELYNRERQNQQ